MIDAFISSESSFDGKNLYQGEAKSHYDSKFYRQAVMEVAQAFSKVGGKGTIKPHQLREEHLNRYGIGPGKIGKCMETVASFIIEFYGIATYELRNPEAIEYYRLTEEELGIIMEYYPVDNMIHEYFKKKYGEDDQRRIRGRITTTERQNIIKTPDYLVDNTLSGLIQKTETQPETSGATI